MIKNLTVTFLALVAISNVTWANTNTCSQNNNSLGSTGLDHPSGTIYTAVTSTTNECSCTKFRFKPEITDTKAALSILMAAKLAEKKVRVDLLDANNCDTAYRVYIQ